MFLPENESDPIKSEEEEKAEPENPHKNTNIINIKIKTIPVPQVLKIDCRNHINERKKSATPIWVASVKIQSHIHMNASNKSVVQMSKLAKGPPQYTRNS